MQSTLQETMVQKFFLSWHLKCISYIRKPMVVDNVFNPVRCHWIDGRADNTEVASKHLVCRRTRTFTTQSTVVSLVIFRSNNLDHHAAIICFIRSICLTRISIIRTSTKTISATVDSCYHYRRRHRSHCQCFRLSVPVPPWKRFRWPPTAAATATRGRANGHRD